MRALLQRVNEASVAGRPVAAIDRGLLVLVAVHRGDAGASALRLAERTLKARSFPGRARASR